MRLPGPRPGLPARETSGAGPGAHAGGGGVGGGLGLWEGPWLGLRHSGAGQLALPLRGHVSLDTPPAGSLSPVPAPPQGPGEDVRCVHAQTARPPALPGQGSPTAASVTDEEKGPTGWHRADLRQRAPPLDAGRGDWAPELHGRSAAKSRTPWFCEGGRAGGRRGHRSTAAEKGGTGRQRRLGARGRQGLRGACADPPLGAGRGGSDRLGQSWRALGLPGANASPDVGDTGRQAPWPPGREVGRVLGGSASLPQATLGPAAPRRLGGGAPSLPPTGLRRPLGPACATQTRAEAGEKEEPR